MIEDACDFWINWVKHSQSELYYAHKTLNFARILYVVKSKKGTKIVNRQFVFFPLLYI